MKAAKRKLAAIMVTDMVGYAALTRRDEALALQLLEQHQQRLRPIFARFGGKEIKSLGDGFLVKFDSALEGARCGIAIQEALREDNRTRPVTHQVHVRIGLHVGEIVQRDQDVFGDGVNIASRLEPLAEPGGICLSQQAYDQLCHKLPATLVPAGNAQLRKLGQFPIYRVDLAGKVTPTKKETSAPDQHTLAVLPFVNLSPMARDEYLSDGITEELISVLGRVRTLRVVSSTSSFAYKGKAEDVRKIGEQLNVGAILEGSLRRLGSQLRISVRLVNVSNGFQIWTETYERRLRDAFAIQQEVARKVVSALDPNALAGVKPPPLEAATTNPLAYQLYLKGRFHWNKRSSDGMTKALQCFRRAAQIDPKCALAYAGMADCYSLNAFYGGVSQRGAFAHAKRAAQKAVRLNPSVAETHTSLAYALLHQDWDLVGCAAEFDAALTLNPAHAPAHLWRGVYFSVCGLHDRAIEEVTKARELEPLSAMVIAAAAMTHYFARQYGRAVSLFEEVLDMEPGFVLAHEGLGQVCLQKHAWKGALTHFNAALSQTKFGGSILAAVAYAEARAGNANRAQALIKQMVKPKATGDASPVDIAIAYIGLKEPDHALNWLQRACREKSGKLIYLNANPIFDDLRQDRRFTALLRKVGLEFQSSN
jgi:TolB-like protein/class 3 adenylate cyclase/Flp pilus assembly protein TadD